MRRRRGKERGRGVGRRVTDRRPAGEAERGRNRKAGPSIG